MISFWASWDAASISERDSLFSLLSDFPEEKFRVLNFSLDTSREDWLKACREDSKQWMETSDFKGMGQPACQAELRRPPAGQPAD